MNLILLFKKDFIETNIARIEGRRFDYIKNIHGAKKDDILTVGLEGGQVGKGTIIEINKDDLKMEVKLDENPPQKINLTLILALPRPNVIKRVLIAASSMGVKKIIFVNCRRVEKSFWRSPVLKEENIRESIILGLEQSKDTIFPDVLLRKTFKPFVEDELPDIIKGTKAFAAHPGSANECPRNISKAVTLFIGPEGGFIDYEIEKLKEAGFTLVDLGPRILRVETAVPFLISRLT